MSAQGRTVKDITTLMQVGEDYVREVIHAFNGRGFDALDPKWSGRRPTKITAFSTWSLTGCSPSTWSSTR
ncbi:helix-turn-helix domain-containing protein [Streptomyces sp. NPDC057889]|uniref:helix-turn-helix domain-containing protein n=1 Tax=unclassified Streptomyces TaxID=2593676 RepID=UPI003687C067